MTRSYDNIFLEDAMFSLGAMLDYAVNTCKEDLSLFYSRFLASGIATQISIGNPKYLSGMSGIEIAKEVARRTGDSLTDMNSIISLGSPEFWTGWTMAYIQWYFNTDFNTLNLKGLTISELHSRYTVLHEADISKSLAFAYSVLNSFKKPLKAARRNSGMSQEELARQSGVPLRTIRAYEQNQLSPANGGTAGILNISKTIGCPIDSLLPIENGRMF